MTIDERVEQLKERATRIAQYYVKGMGDSLTAIAADADAYLIFERNEKYRTAFTWLEEIEQRYAAIPFQDLHEEDFYPLFIVGKLLPRLRRSLERLFETGDKHHLLDVKRYCDSIEDVGYIYRQSLGKALSALTEFTEAKDFTVELMDLNGRRWEWGPLAGNGLR